MSNPRSRLIEAAVRPLSDNAEMKAAASHLFGELVKAEPEGAEEAITRLDAVDARTRRPVWRWVLFSFLLVSSAVLSAYATPRVLGLITAYRALSAMGSTAGSSAGPTITFPKPGRKNLNQEEQWILYGDETQNSKSGKAKGLWDRHPESAAYFLQYVEAYLSQNSSLPADFLTTARRIDPQNAWFTYLAAGVEAKQAVSKKKRSAADRAAGKPLEWDILDQKRLDQSLKLIREAGSQSFLNDYRGDLMRQKIPLLAQGNQLERVNAIGYLAAMSASDLIVMRSLGDAIGVKASQLAIENDTSGFRELMTDAENLSRHTMLTKPSTLVAGLVHCGNIITVSESLAAGAKSLGIHPEAERYQAIHDQIRQGREARKERALLIDGVEFSKKCGLISGLAIPLVHRQVTTPPVITDADLKPGRVTEHEWVGIVFSLGMILSLGISLLACWAFRYRQGVLSSRLSKRLESLLVPADWLLIIGLGVVLPFLLVIGINRFTPLGGRDFSLAGMKYVLPAAHYSALFLLMLILPVLMARLRLGRRTVGFSFKWGKSWAGWISVVCIFAYVVLIGIAVKDGSIGMKVTVVSLLILPEIWLLVTVLRAVFSKPTRVLMAGAIARILIPTYAAAMLLMVWWVPALVAAEAYWFRNDQFTTLDPEFPGVTSFEYKVAAQLQKETRETLGYGPLGK
jgi:hypothetical protein